MDEELPLVTIHCLTYNHEPYICQCLEGVVMQKTNFKFEAIVHDDASTDKTVEIIRRFAEKYPEIIKPIYETENQYSKGAESLSRIINEHTHGKYVAICEGDDYWIDSLKLQKQVDFLESNPDYGIVCGKAKCFIQQKQKFLPLTLGSNKVSFNEMLLNNSVCTLTTMYRRCLFNKYLIEIQPNSKKWLMGDYPLWIWMAYNSKIKFFDEIFAVYRVLQESASNTSDVNRCINFQKSVKEIKIFFYDLYVRNNDIYLKNIYDNYFSYILKQSCLSGNALLLDEVKSSSKYLQSKTLKSKLIRLALNNKFFFIIIGLYWKLNIDVLLARFKNVAYE